MSWGCRWKRWSDGWRRCTKSSRRSSSRFFRQRRGARRRRSLARADVIGPAESIFIRRQLFQLRAAAHSLIEDLFQERDAPTATGPRPAALGELARNLRLGLPHEVHELAAADVETVTDLGVEVHE